MASNISPITDSELEDIKTQMAYADALRKKSLDTGGQMIGRVYVPKNPWQSFIEGAAGAGLGAYQRGRQSDLERRQQQQRNDWLAQMPQATETLDIQQSSPEQAFGPTQAAVVPTEVRKSPRALQQAMTAWGTQAPKGMEGVLNHVLTTALNAPGKEADMQQRAADRMQELEVKMAENRATQQEKREFQKWMVGAQIEGRKDVARLAASLKAANAPAAVPVNQDAADFIAGRFLQGDKNALVGISRNKELHAAVMGSIARQAKEQNIDPKEAVQRGLEYTGASSEQKTMGTQAANVAMAANEANKMIDVASDLSKKVPRTEFPAINTAGNIIAKQSGDPNVVAFAQSIDSLINGYARAINPRGVATVADKKRAHDTLNAAFSNGQFDSTVAVMRREMEAALNAPKEARATAREARMGGGEASKQPKYELIPGKNPDLKSSYREVW